MAKILSMGAGKALWKKLDDFVVITKSCRGSSNKVSVPVSGTFKLLALISSASGQGLKNETQNVIIYSASAANTFYYGTPDSPLATHSYSAGNYLVSSGSTAKICFSGIIGTVPKGLSLAYVGGYYSNITSFTHNLLSGPRRIVYVSIAVDTENSTGTTTVRIAKDNVPIEEQNTVAGTTLSLVNIEVMATGSYSVAELGSGSVFQLLGSSGSAFNVRFAGIILYES